MTRCVMTSAVSVLLSRRNWNTVNSGIRYDSAGVIRAIRISTVSRVRASARDAVAGGNADQQRDQRRAARDDDAVPRSSGPIEFCSNTCTKLAKRRRIGDEHRRIGDVVDLVLERQRQHPQEHQDRRRHDDDDRQPEAELAQRRGACADATRRAGARRRGARSCAHVHFVRWRTCSSSSASARTIDEEHDDDRRRVADVVERERLQVQIEVDRLRRGARAAPS